MDIIKYSDISPQIIILSTNVLNYRFVPTMQKFQMKLIKLIKF